MLATGLRAAFGVEVDAIKCQKAAAFLQQTRAELRRRGTLLPGDDLPLPDIACSAIEQVDVISFFGFMGRPSRCCSGAAQRQRPSSCRPSPAAPSSRCSPFIGAYRSCWRCGKGSPDPPWLRDIASSAFNCVHCLATAMCRLLILSRRARALATMPVCFGPSQLFQGLHAPP